MSQAILALKRILSLPWLYFTSLSTKLPAVFLILLFKVFPVSWSKLAERWPSWVILGWVCLIFGQACFPCLQNTLLQIIQVFTFMSLQCWVLKHFCWICVQGFSIFQDWAVKTHEGKAASFSAELQGLQARVLSVSLLPCTVSSSLHLCRVIVKEHKILIACSLTWMPVFHTL